MKTATIHDLKTRLPMIFSWLEAGEDVVVKSRPTKSAEASTQSQTQVDWSKSVVFKRPISNPPLLSQADLDELFDDMRGPY